MTTGRRMNGGSGAGPATPVQTTVNSAGSGLVSWNDLKWLVPLVVSVLLPIWIYVLQQSQADRDALLDSRFETIQVRIEAIDERLNSLETGMEERLRYLERRRMEAGSSPQDEQAVAAKRAKNMETPPIRS